MNRPVEALALALYGLRLVGDWSGRNRRVRNGVGRPLYWRLPTLSGLPATDWTGLVGIGVWGTDQSSRTTLCSGFLGSSRARKTLEVSAAIARACARASNLGRPRGFQRHRAGMRAPE